MYARRPKAFVGLLSLTIATACRPLATGASAPPKIVAERLTLPNGLTVLLHRDDKLPAVNVNLWYHVGSKDEEPGKTGLAHLFEHMMFQGSKNAPGEYLTLIERAGANLRSGGVNGTTDQDRTNYFETVPASALEYALWLESDRMGSLLEAVDQKGLESQRHVVMNEKRQGDNRPYSAQRYIVAREMYPAGHPYSHAVIGSMEDLAAASLADVQAFFRKYYAPNNASLTLSGSFDLDQAKTLVTRYFGGLPPGEPITRVKADVPTLAADRLVVREERAGVPKLTLVWHAPEYFHADEAALEFAAEILGEGLNARLYKRLVREAKIASRLAAYVTSGEAAGLVYIEVLASPDASLRAIKDTVLAEVRRLAETGPTDAELGQRRAAREHAFLSELERIGGFGGKADRLNRYQTFLGRPDAFDEDFARYQRVTKGDVRRVAREWLTARHHLEIRFVQAGPLRAEADVVDRATAPSLAGTVSYATPEISRTQLSSGLELYVAPRPGLPKVEAALIIKRSDIGETDDTAGVSYMTAVTVNEGTRSRTAEAIQTELAGLGAQLVTEGSKYGSAVALSALKRNLGAAFAILADVVQNPTFPTAETELAKQLRLEQIIQEAGNPALLTGELLPRMIFRGHPAGVPDRGSQASIKALTREALQASHAAYWVPNNAALLLVGDVTMAEAEALVDQHLGDWRAKPLSPATLPPPFPPAGRRIVLVDAPGAPQSQIRIGGALPPRGAPDQIPLELAAALLGGTFSSRLNLNLREDKGYSYGAYASLTQNAFIGWWQAGAGVQSGATVASLVEFRREIDGLGGAIPITAAELTGLKTSLSRSYLQNFETLAQVVRQTAPLISANVPVGFLAEYVPRVLESPPAALLDAARRHLAFDQAVVVVVGDLAVIEPAIRTLGWGAVEVVDHDGKVLR